MYILYIYITYFTSCFLSRESVQVAAGDGILDGFGEDGLPPTVALEGM